MGKRFLYLLMNIIGLSAGSVVASLFDGVEPLGFDEILISAFALAWVIDDRGLD